MPFLLKKKKKKNEEIVKRFTVPYKTVFKKLAGELGLNGGRIWILGKRLHIIEQFWPKRVLMTIISFLVLLGSGKKFFLLLRSNLVP